MYITTIIVVFQKHNIVKYNSLDTRLLVIELKGENNNEERQAIKPLEFELSNEAFEGGDEGQRSKTSIRMHYEAQVAVIRRQMGDLESIRLGLGLSQRKMAQLLMVDPSSWTRWTKQGDEAPPHIWRALQWYSVIQEKIPGLTPQYFINQSPQVLHQKALQELDAERSQRQSELHVLTQKIEGFSLERGLLQSELLKLKKELNFYKKMSIVIVLLSMTLAALLMLRAPGA